jgi:hypothetical protein
MMPAPYNLTNLTGSDTIVDLIVYSNQATNGIIVQGFLIAIFFILTMGFMVKSKFEDSVMASSFICFILSLFLRQAELVSFIFVIGFLVVTAFVGLYNFTVRA